MKTNVIKQEIENWLITAQYPIDAKAALQKVLYLIDSLQEKPNAKFKVGQTITDPTDSTFTFHINKIEDGRYIEKEDEWVLVKEADANYELVEEPVSIWHNASETPSIFGTYLLIHEGGWCVARYLGKEVPTGNTTGWVEISKNIFIEHPQKWLDLRDLLTKTK